MDLVLRARRDQMAAIASRMTNIDLRFVPGRQHQVNVGCNLMTESEWNRCNNAGAMLDWLWRLRGYDGKHPVLLVGGNMAGSVAASADDFDRRLHRYYIASCRCIWPLLPQEASRRGVEVAERYLDGTASAQEVASHEYENESAAFNIDYNCDRVSIERWKAEVRAIPVNDLHAMIHPPLCASDMEPGKLLKDAAYFVHYAMVYTSLRPNVPPRMEYRKFLSANELRRHFEYPGEQGSNAAPSIEK